MVPSIRLIIGDARSLDYSSYLKTRVQGPCSRNVLSIIMLSIPQPKDSGLTGLLLRTLDYIAIVNKLY